MKPDKLSDGLFLKPYPLNLIGCRLGRVVSLLQLSSGKTLIHSSGPFTETDIENFRELGEPCGLIEATNFHDTFTAEAKLQLPNLIFYAPDHFPLKQLGVTSIPVDTYPKDWGDDVVVIPIEGIPRLKEHAVYHRPSRALIVADLMFNLPQSAGKWTLSFMHVMSGMKDFPARSRLFNFYIENHHAFHNSMEKIADLDFDKIVVAHGDPITSNAKDLFVKVMLDRP